MKLMQITSIPENFAVTPSMVETELEEGASFQDELNVRHLLTSIVRLIHIFDFNI